MALPRRLSRTIERQKASEQEASDMDHCVDAPSTGLITERLTRFLGWINRGDIVRGDVAIELNGERQPARLFTRADLVEAGYPNAVCWSFMCDVVSLCGGGGGTVHMEVFVGERSAIRRNFRVEVQSRRRSRELIFAMHVPKTAGTSLREALQGEFGTGMLSYYQNADFAIGQSEIERFSQTALDDIDLFYGHFPWGIHRRLTTREVSYVAFLRRPFDHMLSMFFFKKYALNLPNYCDTDIFEMLVSRGDPDLDNCFTRYFADRIDQDPVGDADLAAAIGNIDRHFRLVGVLDHLDASIDRLNRFLGTNVALQHLNRGIDCTERLWLDVARFRRAAKPHLKLDIQLYDYVLERFWGAGERVEAKSEAAAGPLVELAAGPLVELVAGPLVEPVAGPLVEPVAGPIAAVA